MISGKGILYTVLGAAGAAVLAGRMLTGGNSSEKFRSMGSGIQNFLGLLKSKRTTNSPQELRNRAEFDQANNMGRS
jgi:hypothetical protein